MAKKKLDIITDNLEQIGQWIEEGLFEKNIFPRLGLSKPTWEKYKKESTELCEVLSKSREKRNANLVPELQNLMLKMARGYTDTQSVIEETTKIDDEGRTEIVKKVVSKTYPPNIGAIQICLKNYTRDDPAPWTDNPQGDKLKKMKQALDERLAEDKLNGW